AVAEAVPQPPLDPADGTGRGVPPPRRLFLDWQQASRGRGTLPASDRRGFRAGGEVPCGGAAKSGAATRRTASRGLARGGRRRAARGFVATPCGSLRYGANLPGSPNVTLLELFIRDSRALLFRKTLPVIGLLQFGV